MPARDYAIYTGFRRGGAPEYQITGMRRGGGVEIPVAPSTPPLETAPIAQPTMVIPANAATFQTAAGWTIPTGVTVDTTGNGRAVVDDFWAIIGALVLSLVLSLLFTGWLMQKLIERQARRRGES